MFSRRTPTDPTIGLGVFFVIMLILFAFVLNAVVSAKAYFWPAAAPAAMKRELCKCGVACACADQE